MKLQYIVIHFNKIHDTTYLYCLAKVHVTILNCNFCCCYLELYYELKNKKNFRIYF